MKLGKKSISVLLLTVLTLSAILMFAPKATGAALVLDFRQYANLDKRWINSILQQSNSRYYEGMSVPQRIIFTNIPSTSGNVHTLTLAHMFTKGGIHAYDFLTAWNQCNVPPLIFDASGEDIGPPKSLASVCQYLHEAPGSGAYEYFVEVPDDGFLSKDGSTQDRIDAYETLYGDRLVRICGNKEITYAGFSQIEHDVSNGGDTGDSWVYYTLTWTSESDQILIELAGHLAMSGDPSVNPIAWGIGLGSSQIPGGPYHFKIFKLDGASLGNQDNQIMGASILVRPGIELTKTPSVSKVTNGGSVTYTYVVTNTGDVALTVNLVDDVAGTIVTGYSLPAGASATFTKTVTLTTPEPSVTNTATATGTTGEGATVTATATATVQVIHPAISLVKSGPAKAEVGSTVTFTYEVTNTGDCSLNVVVEDDVLGSIWSGSLAAGASHTETKDWTAFGDSMTNTATATGTDQTGATVTATDSHTIDVLNPAISITKSGDPPSQLAPGTVTWTITVTNTGDVILDVDVSDTRYGVLEMGLSLAPGATKTYTYTESGLPPGTYTNVATAVGYYQFGSVTATASATVEVIRVSVLKEFTAVSVLPGSGFGAELVDPTHVNVYGLKSGPNVYFTVQYYFENSLNFLGDDFDGQAHKFTLWDKWGGNLMALGSPPTSFSDGTLILAGGLSFNIDPRKSGLGTYRGYIGSGLDISSLASQGTAYITMHLGDQQQGTNPGKGKGTNKDSTSYDTDIVWYIGELTPGDSATLTVYIAPGMNPGGQLEFTSLGFKVINTGPRVRAYGATYGNEDFLYAVERTNTLTVCVNPLIPC